VRRRRYLDFVVAAVAFLAGSALDPLAAQEALYDADQVKAAFLYHFGTYVQWPTVAPSTDPITIAVLGEGAVTAQLARFLPGRRIQGRPVEVRPLERIEELGDEELLFISREHNTRLAELIAAVEQRPVLVVTDAEDGLDRGAMVNFQLVEARVRFEVSLPRAEEAGLMLSSRLLSAALRVETSECCMRERNDTFARDAPKLRQPLQARPAEPSTAPLPDEREWRSAVL
jgi:hypothetical protein